jgi:hypothetical protein
VRAAPFFSVQLVQATFSRNHLMLSTLSRDPSPAPPPYRSREFPQPLHDSHGNLKLPEVTATSPEKRSLDFIQRIERKLAAYNSSQNVFKRWLFEILSWCTSASCMAATVGVYLAVKNNPVLLTGNLLTYVLGKVASAALIVPTSEALGQLNWFHKSNAM